MNNREGVEAGGGGGGDIDTNTQNTNMKINKLA